LAIASRGTDLSQAHIFGDFNSGLSSTTSRSYGPPRSCTTLRSIPPGTIYLTCGLDPPFSSEESVCVEALPTFRDAAD
jgi:hypothetical protein